MAVRLVEHSDPRRFAEIVLPRLMQAEAENCLAISLTRQMEKGYSPVSVDALEHPMLLTIEGEQTGVEAVALQTMKREMAVTRASDEAMECLAEGLARRSWGGEFINGPAPAVRTLARRYSEMSGRAAHLNMGMRLFQLDQVQPPRAAPGAMRLCTPEDRQWAGQWLKAFEAEIDHPSTEDGVSMAARMIEARRMYCWMDGAPVSMAVWAGPTPRGVRISLVYTPPQYRVRGYASNLVAQLSQRLLDEGKKFCFLYADVANPTSNSVYQKIGYRAVCDWERWQVSVASMA